MYYVVYKITNNIDGKIYIGCHMTKDINDSYMGSGKYLRRAQVKYGIENFTKELLFVYDNKIDMYNKEAEIVNEEFLATQNTYNLKLGGRGGWDYLNSENFNNPTHSFEHLSKMGRNSKGFSGKRHVDSSKQIISEKAIIRQSITGGAFLGKQHTIETRQKMSDSMQGKQTGEKNSQFGSMWITNGVINKKISRTDQLPDGFWRGRKC